MGGVSSAPWLCWVILHRAKLGLSGRVCQHLTHRLTQRQCRGSLCSEGFIIKMHGIGGGTPGCPGRLCPSAVGSLDRALVCWDYWDSVCLTFQLLGDRGSKHLSRSPVAAEAPAGWREALRGAAGWRWGLISHLVCSLHLKPLVLSICPAGL